MISTFTTFLTSIGLTWAVVLLLLLLVFAVIVLAYKIIVEVGTISTAGYFKQSSREVEDGR
jgi:hypothetical protein